MPPSSTRKFLIAFGLVVVGIVLAFAAVIAYTFMGRKAVVDGAEVNGIRIVADGIVTTAIVPLDSGGLALIDAGNDSEGLAIIEELSRRGLGVDAVEVILITHGHADHIGAVRRFPNAAVMALEDEVPLIEGREGARGPLTRLMPVSATGIRVTRPLRDGEGIAVGGTTVKVFAVPGHTRGSAAYLVKEVLFVGDSADAASDSTLQPAPWIFSDNQSQNRQALASLSARLKEQNLTVRAIAPAHSGLLPDGAAQLDAFAASAR